MRFGIKTAPHQTDWQPMLDVWRAADEVELFESAWNFDHFYPLIGEPSGPCMECWVTLAALAANTKRIRVGSMVNGVPYRHPGLMANMAASLDIVSGGRLELGLGAGWHQPECDAYGIPLGSLRTRFDRFDEAVEIIVRLLSQDVTDFVGKFFQLANARCEPKGPQRPHPPIVIGGGGEKRTLRTAARFAQHWNLPRATPEVFTHKKAVLLRHCERVGRDASEITCSVQVHAAANETPAAAAERAAALRDAGVDLVIFTLGPPYAAGRVEPLARAVEGL